MQQGEEHNRNTVSYEIMATIAQEHFSVRELRNKVSNVLDAECGSTLLLELTGP